MKTFIYCNQKGGVGKSTFAVHHALHSVKQEQRVLFLDLDSQGNSSATMRHHTESLFTAHHLYEPQLQYQKQLNRLTLYQGTSELQDVDRLPHHVVKQFTTNMKRLESDFDVCIIDTPPALGLRLMSALIYGQFVICPFELASYSMQGIGQIIATIHGIQERYNPALTLIGFLPNRVNSRSHAHRTAMHEICSRFAQYIIRKKMVNRVAVQEALDQGCAVWDLKTSTAKVAATEILDIIHTIETATTQETHNAYGRDQINQQPIKGNPSKKQAHTDQA